MKKFLLSLFCTLMAFTSIQAEEQTATLSFADKAQRTSYSTTQQIWEQNRITFTNNKGSGNSIGDYANPVRIYKNSEVIVECSLGNITQIIFDCNSKDYATLLEKSITGATIAEDKVTVTLDGTSNSFTFVHSNNATRIDELTVTYTVENGGDSGETPVAPAAPTLPASCSFDNSMTVKITDIEDGATVYYTLDGTTPTESCKEYSAPFEITATTTVKAIAVNAGGASETASATYTKNATEPETPTEPEEPEVTNGVTDVLSRDFTGVTGTTYSDWSGKTATSNAVYAGNSAGGNESIQLRTTNKNSGIVTTASGGKVKKVVVEWNSNTTAGRTLDIYGKSTPYSSAADLYGDNQGTKLGSIVYGTSTKIEITGDYEYIGLRSKDGAMYLTSITITWDATKVLEAVDAPTISSDDTEEEFNADETINVTITAVEGATIHYTLDGNAPTTESDIYEGPISINETTTVKAIAVKEGLLNSAVAEKSYIKVMTVTEFIKAYNPDKQVKAAVIGYIVGTAKNNTINQAEFGNTDPVATNLIIADSPDETTAANCITVELGTGTFKTALNLVDNKSLYKKKIKVTGTASKYLNAPGVKDLSYAGIFWEVTDVDYATLFFAQKIEVPATVEAYIIKEASESFVQLTQVEGILPKETGIILKGEGEHLFNITNAAATANVTGNLLKGSAANAYINEEAYILSRVDDVVGLYLAKMNKNENGEDGSTHFLNNANKAYLPASAISEASGISFYGFRFDDEETTGIEEVETEESNVKVIYDLAGRRISEITAPGIYIIGGRKVLIK